MATLNISLPDELKMRMDATNENWSAIARRAFELQLKSTMSIGDNDMNTVIERLRASKQKIEEVQRPGWIEEGRKWAMETAEYDQLERVAQLAELDAEAMAPDAGALFRALCEAIYEDGDGYLREELAEQLTGDARRWPSYDQLCWYIEGVQQVWNEVSDEI
ncbi:hypothetical protein [Rhizobium sp. K102]|uniref:hypothetical protein n=1 Tax=Rhizobium sp. K102 TaxID=2918527 RepID=UPI001EFB65AF|nr:hypothetical protein [Rhizobium sp. K102]ULR43632.1 hypothetical protein MHI61_20985 [Rhizobium sp. K102]